MTLTQLNYILAVAKHRHFGTAAEACFVTQPTLSMQIQKLEEDLGLEIFDRSKQPVEPTSLGALVIAQARNVVAEAQKIRSLITSTKDEVAGPLRIGVIPTLAPSLLPLFIASLSTQYPKLEISVEELQTHQIVEALKEERLDAGLLVTPLGNPAITEQPLFQEPFLLYLSPDHPLMKAKKVTEHDLSSAEVWLLNEGHCFRDQVLSLCSDARRMKTARHNLRFESGNLETLKKMVEQSGGYTLLPALAARDIDDPIRRKRLKSFESPVPSREVSVVHHRLFARQAVIRALVEEIQKNLPSDVTRLKAGTFRRVDMKTFE